mmetsp:Transcript_19862/g.19971  ORF Transcript_19862/g.19971 Transcript_19862/m.19971 type:complete len:84 (+) Transcript_19862:210-461(+)
MNSIRRTATQGSFRKAMFATATKEAGATAMGDISQYSGAMIGAGVVAVAAPAIYLCVSAQKTISKPFPSASINKSVFVIPPNV